MIMKVFAGIGIFNLGTFKTIYVLEKRHTRRTIRQKAEIHTYTNR